MRSLPFIQHIFPFTMHVLHTLQNHPGNHARGVMSRFKFSSICLALNCLLFFTIGTAVAGGIAAQAQLTLTNIAISAEGEQTLTEKSALHFAAVGGSPPLNIITCYLKGQPAQVFHAESLSLHQGVGIVHCKDGYQFTVHLGAEGIDCYPVISEEDADILGGKDAVELEKACANAPSQKTFYQLFQKNIHDTLSRILKDMEAKPPEKRDAFIKKMRTQLLDPLLKDAVPAKEEK